MLGQLDYAAPQILTDLADLVMPGRDKLSSAGSGLRHRLGGAVVQAAAPRAWTASICLPP